MKFLSVIAASLAAYATAQQQQPKNFRGAATAQKTNWRQKFGNKDQNSNPKDKDSNNKWQQKPNRWQKGQNDGQKDWQKHKGGKTCSLKRVPPTAQQKYAEEFKSLDVNDNKSLDAKEFSGEEAKIADAFHNFRKHKKPSWYKGGKGDGKGGRGDGKGGRGDGKGGRGDGKGGRGDGKGGRVDGKGGRGDGKGGRGGRGGRGDGKGGRGGRGGDKSGQKGPGRQLQDQPGSKWMQWLQKNGFKHQKTQTQKDDEDAKRAGRVFQKFDRDHNGSISVCEYTNAMYRTQQMEDKMSGKKDDDVVVVSGN